MQCLIYSNNLSSSSLFLLAGCDELDSDGDKEVDKCEDRYPPNLLVRDPAIFRCNDYDTTQLCNTDKWFKNEKQLLNFLEYEFPAADDCAGSTKLGVNILYSYGSCQDTKYELTPFQNYSDCNDIEDVGPFNLSFVNPLSGLSREVTIQLDKVAPVIECGFLPQVNGTNTIDEDGKTLYSYVSKTNIGDGTRLNDARLYYNISVSKLCCVFVLSNGSLMHLSLMSLQDNCDADINVDVVVKSNEIQQDKNGVAELFKTCRDGSVEQAQLLFAPTQ